MKCGLIFGAAKIRNNGRWHQLLTDAYHAGFETFDTARTYGGGESEAALGAWLKKTGYIATVITKGGINYRSEVKLDRKNLEADADASRAALNLDALDMLLLHRDDETIAVEEIVESMHELITRGKIKSFGVSNWSISRIKLALEHSRAQGISEIKAISNQFSLAEWISVPWAGCKTIAGSSRKEDRDWVIQSSIPFLAWSSLGNGFLLGNASNSEYGSRAVEVPPVGKGVYHTQRSMEKIARAMTLAEEKSLTVAQIAIAYVLSHSRTFSAILTSTRKSHLKECIAATEYLLTPAELDFLDGYDDTQK